MDPSRREAARIVSDTELRAHREQSERLIATARSGLQALFRQVAGQNYVLLLTNAQGVCVDFFGDARFEDDLRAAGLYLGSDWSEDLAGTCGVGACLVSGEAVTIHQDDHFDISHTPLSCTAAPIFDSTGQLTAVLDISLLRSPTPKSSQALAMNLVKASARRVELANLMHASRREWVLRLAGNPEFLDIDPDAAVTLDGSGRIVGMTHGARTMLGLEGTSHVIGQRIDTFLEMSIDDLPDLMRDRATEDRIVRRHDGGLLFGHAIAPRTPQGGAGPVRRRRDGALADFAGPDASMDALLAQVERLASTDIPLLIAGETGTGKTRLARGIHTIGRAGRPFVFVDCASIDADGIAAADPRDGTVFLYGICGLPPALHSRLASWLDAHPRARIIASARGDPARTLDPALLYRLAGTTFTLPPLRLRHDIDWLIDRMLRRRLADAPNLSPGARAELLARSWPGNLRELDARSTSPWCCLEEP